MKRYSTWICFLVALLLLAFTPPVAQPLTANAADTGSYAVDLHIHGSGDFQLTTGSGNGSYSQTGRRTVDLDGSTILRPAPGGGLRALPFSLTVSDQYEEILDTYYIGYNGPCTVREQIQDFIIDPAEWTGGPDPFWGNPILFYAYQRPDKTWYMLDPVWQAFVVNGQMTRYFTYRHNFTRDGCGSSTSFTLVQQSTSYFALFTGGYNPHPLEGGTAGTVFTANATYTNKLSTADGHPSPYSFNVQYSVTVRKLGGCAGRVGPIDASDPVIQTLDIVLDVDKASIPPNDLPGKPARASLQAKITCEGVTVKNAELRVRVNALDKSGGHLHGDTTNPRPRGYLRIPGQSWTEITAQTPYITVKTDGKGQAKFDFKPGTDYFQNTRGIAGTYTITATSTLFPARSANRAVEVERSGFVELPVPASYYIITRGGASRHPDGSWGTQATIDGVGELAQDFWNAQIEHNRVLTESGKTAWPLYPLSVNDISLKSGGLYDTGGWNVVTNQQAGFIAWQPPHMTHMNGIGVDLNTKQWSPQSRYNWLRATLVALGHDYGTWANEPTLHLNFPANPADRPAATGADTGVSIFLTGGDADTRTRTAAGQILSYTIGVDNLHGSAAAAGTIVTAGIPAGMTFLAASPGPSRLGAGGQPVWDLGSLSAGASPQTIELNVQVNPGVTAGTVLTVSAEVSTTSAETRLDNNHDESFGLVVQAPGPDLVAVSDLDAVVMTTEKPVTVTLGVINAGNMPASGATLSLTLPVSVTLLSAGPVSPAFSAGSWNWNLGTLQADEFRIMTATLLIDPALGYMLPAAGTSQLLTYTVRSSASGDIDLSNNSEQVVRPVEIAGNDGQVWFSVDGTGDDQTLSAGQELTYTLRYANYGNQIASSTTLTLSLWSGLNPVSFDPAPTQIVTSTVYGGGVVSWSLGNQAVGQVGSIQVRVHVASVPASGSLVLATLSSPGTDTNPLNNVAYEWRWASVPQQRYAVMVPVSMRQTAGGW